MSAQVHDRITIEPDKMDGQPCIRVFASPSSPFCGWSLEG